MTTLPLTSDQQQQIVDYVNMYRAKNQAPPLVWDSTITLFSQHWADYLSSNKLFKHSGSQLYGENLAYFQGYGNDTMTLLKDAVDAWYKEISAYNFSQPGFSEATGHFTCLVWVASTHLGLGISFDTTTNSAIITMNTSPPGNVIGAFQQNVLPLVGSMPPVIVPPTTPPTQPPATNACSPSMATKVQLVNEIYDVINSIHSNRSKTVIDRKLSNIIHEIMAL
jgi:hypothetical protein